jgi:hypothetical protein
MRDTYAEPRPGARGSIVAGSTGNHLFIDRSNYRSIPVLAKNETPHLYLMSTFRRGPAWPPRTADVAAELAHDPAASLWAQTCGWVSGTGHCRNRDCAEACVFHAQREADQRRVARWRRRRRIGLRPEPR